MAAKTPSTHPVLPVRVHPDVLATIEARAEAAGISRAAMAELVVNAGLQALGEDPPEVDPRAKEVRRVVMEFKKKLGAAAEEALREFQSAG